MHVNHKIELLCFCTVRPKATVVVEFIVGMHRYLWKWQMCQLSLDDIKILKKLADHYK